MYNTPIYLKQEKVVVMIKIVKNFGICMLVSCISYTSFAKKDVDIDADELAASSNDYDASYYENEGSLTFKARAYGVKTNAKPKGLPTPTNLPANSVGSFVSNGFGGDASTTVFFNSNIAAELSVGLSVLRTRYATLANIGGNYIGGNNSVGKRKDLYMIPVTLTGQYHIAPFGAIRPYVGGGYHVALFVNKSKMYKIKNGSGPVAQIGVDFYAKDDTLINFDIRQYFLNTKVNYKSNLVGPAPVSSKVKLNPLVVSLGIGFKF